MNNKYINHSEAFIISCYFNPLKNNFRLDSFKKYYETIKHLNHVIIESDVCDNNSDIKVFVDNYFFVKTETISFQKESLLNYAIARLPEAYKYVFWIDADVIFTNRNWLVDSVKKLQESCNIIQPFEKCFHLKKDNTICNNSIFDGFVYSHKNGNTLGHTGFAWGARREILKKVPLFSKAVYGGGAYMIALAAVGITLDENTIQKCYIDILEEIQNWSKSFNNLVLNKIDNVSGDIHHIWHGDIEKRKYKNRIKYLTEKINIINTSKDGVLELDDISQKNFLEYYKYRENV